MIDWGFVALLELVLFAGICAFLAVRYFLRSDWRSTSIGPLLLALFSLLFLLLVGIVAMAFAAVPSWPFALVGAGLDVVGWLIGRQLLRAQRARD